MRYGPKSRGALGLVLHTCEMGWEIFEVVEGTSGDYNERITVKKIFASGA